MPRYKLLIEYDGAPFAGWQIQAGQPTVQGVLTEAVEAFCGEKVSVSGAGRTDAGVHALGQVAHVDLRQGMGQRYGARCANAQLRPHPVAVLAAERVADDFDARFSARARHYRVSHRQSPRRSCARSRPRLAGAAPARCRSDARAAQGLVGKHDFTTFRAAECQAKSPVKTLDRLDVEREGDEIRLSASARSFLHHQVRSMVGSLALVGEGRWSTKDLTAALEARDRSACGPIAPPDGLYLVRVEY